MKQIILILSILVIVSSTIFSQEQQEKNVPDKSKESGSIDKQVKRMTKELNLTKEQEKKIRILLKNRQEILRSKSGKKKLERDPFDGELLKILSPEQYQKYLQNRDETRKEHNKKIRAEQNNNTP